MLKVISVFITLLFLIYGNFASSSLKEDCTKFDRTKIFIKQRPDNPSEWAIVIKVKNNLFSYMTNHPNKAEAEQSLSIIKKYKYSYQCFVGRPDASMEYWK